MEKKLRTQSKIFLLFITTVLFVNIGFSQVEIASQRFHNGNPGYQDVMSDKDGVLAPASNTVNTHVGTDNWDYTASTVNIQAYSAITADKVVSLNFRSAGDYSFEIKVSETENLVPDQEIYIKDNETGEYFNLTTKQAYRFESAQGIFNERFQIVFQNQSQTLSAEANVISKSDMYFQHKTHTFFVNKQDNAINKLSLVNMRGQVVLELDDVSSESLQSGIQFKNISTGAYIVLMRTETNEVLTKKIVVK